LLGGWKRARMTQNTKIKKKVKFPPSVLLPPEDREHGNTIVLFIFANFRQSLRTTILILRGWLGIGEDDAEHKTRALFFLPLPAGDHCFS
jgi:hypothetical protein